MNQRSLKGIKTTMNLNKNENTTYQNQWDANNEALRGKLQLLMHILENKENIKVILSFPTLRTFKNQKEKKKQPKNPKKIEKKKVINA